MKLQYGIAIILGLCGFCLRAEATPNYCEGKGTAQMDKRKQESTLKAWMKSPNTFRLEEIANKRTVVTICDGVHIWLLSPANKSGVHRLRSPNEVAAMASKQRVIGDDLAGFLKAGGKLKGKEVINGTACELYELKKEGITHRIWVAPAPDRVTIRRMSFGSSEFSTGPGQPMQRHTIRREMTYSWKSNVPLPERLFKVPGGYKIQETKAAPPPVFAPPRGKKP